MHLKLETSANTCKFRQRLSYDLEVTRQSCRWPLKCEILKQRDVIEQRQLTNHFHNACNSQEGKHVNQQLFMLAPQKAQFSDCLMFMKSSIPQLAVLL